LLFGNSSRNGASVTRKGNEVCDCGQVRLLAGIGVKSPAHVSVRDGLHQFAYLGLEKLVRHDQRLHGFARVTAARRDCLIGRSV